MLYIELAYATREPPKMAQFDWFAISGYWAISYDCDRDGRLVTLIKTNKPLIKTNKSRQKVLSCLFLE